MTKLLSIAARADAPVACDMRGAPDTLTQRLAEYRRLFQHALLGRESTATTTTFSFAARPGVREWVCDLAKREAACCPFLSYKIVEEDEKIVWTTAGLGASDIAILNEFLDSGSVTASSEAIAERLGTRDFPSSFRSVSTGRASRSARRSALTNRPGWGVVDARFQVDEADDDQRQPAVCVGRSFGHQRCLPHDV